MYPTKILPKANKISGKAIIGGASCACSSVCAEAAVGAKNVINNNLNEYKDVKKTQIVPNQYAKLPLMVYVA